jgi:hypothetical protein
MKTPTTTTKTQLAPEPMLIPTKRNLHFALDGERIADWYGGNRHLSHFLNTLSIFFPEGERFFIQSVRQFRRPDMPVELTAAVNAFIAQESLHGREHDAYNKLFFDYFPQARENEQIITRSLRRMQRRRSASAQLAATMALEHLTAIMADAVLSDARLTENMEPNYRALWQWHALEETEHKAVAFDVWVHTHGKTLLNYLQRCFGLVTATTIFCAFVTPFFLQALRSDGLITDGKGWRVFTRFMVGEIGFLRKLVLPWLAYLRPGFHPWRHNNRSQLTRLDAIAAMYAREKGAAA